MWCPPENMFWCQKLCPWRLQRLQNFQKWGVGGSADSFVRTPPYVGWGMGLGLGGRGGGGAVSGSNRAVPLCLWPGPHPTEGLRIMFEGLEDNTIL